eukprot:13402277-Alexandrium_andersonii.AAC.1
MSASLVGSEMCIRDRPSNVLRAQQPRACKTVTRSSVVRLVSAHSFMSPVSYTHLTLPTICSV